MFSNQNDSKLEKNILRSKREEFRQEIRKRNIDEEFRLRRKVGVAQQIKITPQEVIQEFENQQTKNFETLFNFSAGEDDQANKNLTYLLEYGLLSKIIPHIDSTDPQLQYIYGILGNLSTIEEYKNQDEKLIALTLGRGFHYLLQKTKQFATIDNILVYIANISEYNEQLSEVYQQHQFITILLNLAEEIQTIFSNPSNIQAKQQAETTMSNIYYVLFTVIKNQLNSNEESLVFKIIKIGICFVTETLRFDILTLLTKVIQDSSESLLFSVIETKLVDFLMESLNTQYYGLALRVIKLITHLEAPQHQPSIGLIHKGILEKIQTHLSNRNEQIRKDCYLILSNLSYSNQDIIGQILAHQVTKKLFNVLSLEKEQEQIYAMACVVNMLSISSQKQYEILIEQRLVEILATLIQSDDSTLLQYVLQALQSLCNYGREIQNKTSSLQNNIVRNLRLLNIIPYLERLQKHKSRQVYQGVEKLLVSYFNYSE